MDSTHFFRTACLFEASLILLALVFAWISGINPLEQLYFSEMAIAVGLLGTVPLCLLFLSLEHFPQQSLSDIRELLLKTLAANLHTRSWTDLFLLAAIAGISEELLFRGVIQPWISASWGVLIGLWATNIIFGLVHAITPLYALLVTLVGLYLSYSMQALSSEPNLLIPIIIHGLYDFLAFIALMRIYKNSLRDQDDAH